MMVFSYWALRTKYRVCSLQFHKCILENTQYVPNLSEDLLLLLWWIECKILSRLMKGMVNWKQYTNKRSGSPVERYVLSSNFSSHAKASSEVAPVCKMRSCHELQAHVHLNGTQRILYMIRYEIAIKIKVDVNHTTKFCNVLSTKYLLAD